MVAASNAISTDNLSYLWPRITLKQNLNNIIPFLIQLGKALIESILAAFASHEGQQNTQRLVLCLDISLPPLLYVMTRRFPSPIFWIAISIISI